MKYACLVHLDEEKLNAVPKNGFAALVVEAKPFISEFLKNEHFVATERLQPSRRAATLRVRNDEIFVTDGPFAETKEQLAGFVLVEASDRADAVQIASEFPAVPYGNIEVRPAESLDLQRPE